MIEELQNELNVIEELLENCAIKEVFENLKQKRKEIIAKLEDCGLIILDDFTMEPVF